jgi:hypothetical protein
MRTIANIIVAVLALTVMAPGHAQPAVEAPVSIEQNFIARVDATPTQSTVDQLVNQTRDTLEVLVQTLTKPWITFSVSSRDQDCLTRNIYFEARGESEEGKVAVGIVTINRVRDGRFGNSICAVVNQRTVTVRSTAIPQAELVQTGAFGGTHPVTKNKTIITYVPVCQFSWVCAFVQIPHASNSAWEESRRVAQTLLDNGYEDYRIKYNNALYFHSSGVRPSWSGTMSYIARVGRHLFYTDRL